MNEQATKTGKRWSFCAKGYSDIVEQEYDEVGTVWVDLLKKYMPCEKGRALDVGMGPGFFTILLTQLGWDVTGIDCAEAMVAQAQENLARRALSADCRVMDSHAIEFPDNTFDYIVARNATWLLYEPEKAFREWLRVLKPGGCLMYMDANWPYMDDAELTRRMKADEAAFEKKYGRKAPNTYTGDEKTNEEFNALVAFSHIFRPTWDEKMLPALGYTDVTVAPRVNERIYPLWKQELYKSIDVFVVAARKP